MTTSSQTMFKLRRPCAKCPFRTDVPGFLRRERAAEIARGIAEGEIFPCHQTAFFDQDEETGEDYVGGDDPQFCAGALILMEKLDMPNQAMRMAERLDLYDRSRMQLDAPVVDSFIEFVNHHGADDADIAEPETCHCAEQGCLAPAGMLVGGQVIYSEPEGETHECPSCGEFVCDNCSDDQGVCTYCEED